jgi:hypothetical protein
VSTPKNDIPALPGGPAPGEPVPETPVDGLDLKAFATIAARLASGEGRAAVLARYGLNEARWLGIESTWMLRIATALLRDDRSLHSAYDEAFCAAQRELSGGRPEVA